jgi:DNA-binding IscR family transcriptional regulator
VSRVLLKAWREIDDQEREMLRSTTFADLADRLKDEAEQMYYI